MSNTNFNQSNGLVRLSSVIAPNGPIPVSKSTWWAGIKLGRFPRPVKIGPRTTAWRTEEIRQFIANPELWLTASENITESKDDTVSANTTQLDP